jgi:adenylyl cyclase-associated protein
MSADLAALVARLEAVTSRLEGVGAGGGGGGGAASGGAAEGGSNAMTEEYDEFLQYVATYVEQSNKIGGDVAEQAALVNAAFQAQRAMLGQVAVSAKPSDADFAALLGPTAGPLGEVIAFRDSHRSSKEFNHLTAMSEGIPALAWVQVTPKPAPHADQMGQAAEFSLNRVIKDHKDDADKIHVEWAKNLKAMWPVLVAFIKKHHTTGLVWNPKGGKASVAAAAAAPAAAKPAAAKPAAKKAGGGGIDLGAALAGRDASGLKKVDKSQMTHKNPNLRATSVVGQAGGAKKAAPAKKFGGGPKGDPLFELQGNKWKVEFQKDNQAIEITDTEPKQVVYVYGCQNTVVQVKGKVNSIMIDTCKKTSVVFETCVSVVEVVNGNGIKMQCINNVPSIAIDKTSGCQVFLSKTSLDCEFTCAKSDEMNIVIPGETEDDDITEFAVPEQFKTTYNKEKKCIDTVPVAHL